MIIEDVKEKIIMAVREDVKERINGCEHAHACLLAMGFSIIVLPFFFRTLVVHIRFPIHSRIRRTE